MAGINKVILIGNLGRDPELRESKGGMPICNLSIATTSKRKQGEEWVEETEWHRVVTFGKTAENCDRFLRKGSKAYVEGRLRTTSYEKDGVKRYSTEVIADTVQFLDSKSDGGGESRGSQRGGSQGGSSGGGYGRKPDAGYGSNEPKRPEENERRDDDIPF